MNRLLKLLLLPLLAVGALAVYVQPAGAYITSTTDWNAGRRMTDLINGAGPGGAACTSGPHFYAYAIDQYVMALPRHCVEKNGCGSGQWQQAGYFTSRYEDSTFNYFDSSQLLLSTHASYPCIDMVLVKLGYSGDVYAQQRASNAIFNYCNPYQLWNCSSYYGGGYAVNGNWLGAWKYNTGYGQSGQYAGWGSVCKSGAKSGTSCGAFSGTYAWFNTTNTGGAPYVSPVNMLNNLGGCASAQGDSGSPVYYEPSGSWNVATSTTVSLVGMGVGFGNEQPIYTANGNSCFSNGVQWSQSMAVIPVDVMRSAFSGYNIVPLTSNV